jgi:thiosulfate/3-mercaptopyruvate sulfurtransferase
LGSENIVIFDASFFLPNQNRSAQAEYCGEHIPGALFFDIDTVADHASDLPHMLPSPAQFAQAVGAMGVGNDTWVIAYDNNFFMASARLWWTFRIFGHDRVSVLDGGLAAWKQAGLPLDALAPSPRPQAFQAGFRPSLVRDMAQMRALLAGREAQILDARSAERFAGVAPEPRAGVRSGHIPHSRNLPARMLVDEASHCLKTGAALVGLYQQAGIDTAQAIVTTCGTGVTAAILALGLYTLGVEDVAVYDGSWTEWGGREDTPVALGAAS